MEESQVCSALYNCAKSDIQNKIKAGACTEIQHFKIGMIQFEIKCGMIGISHLNRICCK